MHRLSKILLLLSLLLVTLNTQVTSAKEPQQSPVNPSAEPQLKFPKIVLYSVSWCPHCKAAKEYFTSHDIPFINKDVELDSAAMGELTDKYKSQGVPVIVMGDDTVILKGFDQEQVEKAIKRLQK